MFGRRLLFFIDQYFNVLFLYNTVYGTGNSCSKDGFVMSHSPLPIYQEEHRVRQFGHNAVLIFQVILNGHRLFNKTKSTPSKKLEILVWSMSYKVYIVLYNKKLMWNSLTSLWHSSRDNNWLEFIVNTTYTVEWKFYYVLVSCLFFSEWVRISESEIHRLNSIIKIASPTKSQSLKYN